MLLLKQNETKRQFTDSNLSHIISLRCSLKVKVCLWCSISSLICNSSIREVVVRCTHILSFNHLYYPSINRTFNSNHFIVVLYPKCSLLPLFKSHSYHVSFLSRTVFLKNILYDTESLESLFNPTSVLLDWLGNKDLLSLPPK